MKNNTERAKNFLVQAIRAMPNDFALSEARSCLNRALSEIQKTEGRRVKNQIKNQITEQQTTTPAAPVVWTPKQVMDVVNHIDKLIEDEKKKIAEIEAERRGVQQITEIERRLLHG